MTTKPILTQKQIGRIRVINQRYSFSFAPIPEHFENKLFLDNMNFEELLATNRLSMEKILRNVTIINNPAALKLVDSHLFEMSLFCSAKMNSLRK